MWRRGLPPGTSRVLVRAFAGGTSVGGFQAPVRYCIIIDLLSGSMSIEKSWNMTVQLQLKQDWNGATSVADDQNAMRQRIFLETVDARPTRRFYRTSLRSRDTCIHAQAPDSW